jgi:RNA polymerase-interacting CarD/CdnL/TRCF family regulator
MDYAIGDTVVHWTHGLGTVIAIDEMHLAGITQQYYVVEVDLLKIWVPVDEANKGSIRFPTESIQFKGLFDILRTPGERLPDHQYQRRIELRERMQKRTPEDLFYVIRDLTDRSRNHTLNQNDSFVLSRAEALLVDEWVLSLGAERSNAIHELKVLLEGDPSEPKGQ